MLFKLIKFTSTHYINYFSTSSKVAVITRVFDNTLKHLRKKGGKSLC